MEKRFIGRQNLESGNDVYGGLAGREWPGDDDIGSEEVVVQSKLLMRDEVEDNGRWTWKTEVQSC